MYAFINIERLCQDSASFFINIKSTAYTDEVREKVPSFKKVTDVINLHFCLFKDVTYYRDLRRIKLKRFLLIGLFVFLHSYIRQTLLAV